MKEYEKLLEEEQAAQAVLDAQTKKNTKNAKQPAKVQQIETSAEPLSPPVKALFLGVCTNTLLFCLSVPQSFIHIFSIELVLLTNWQQLFVGLFL